MRRATVLLGWSGVLTLALLAHQPPVDPPGASNGSTLRLRATRDSSLSSFSGEEAHSQGSEESFKLKGIQEFALLDFDLGAARGRVVTAATLHLHHRSGPPLLRGTVSSLAAPWIEGDGTRWLPRGGSSFGYADTEGTPWAPGGDLTSVMNGAGGTVWSTAAAIPPDARSWQRVAVEPRVIAARLAELSQGFVLFDDIGSEYRREADVITHLPFPNHLFSTREAGSDVAPLLVLELGAGDRQAPERVVDLQALSTGDAAPGTAWLRWSAPSDRGPAGVLGFEGRYTAAASFSWETASPVPQHWMPAAPSAGEEARLELRGLGDAGASFLVGIRAVDAAGNPGEATVVLVRLAAAVARLLASGDDERGIADAPSQDGAPAALPSLGRRTIWIADALDAVDPVSGAVLPATGDDYRAENHLWSASRRQVSLASSRNEMVAFQVVPSGEVAACRIAAELRWEGAGSDGVALTVWRPQLVAIEERILPDPLASASGPAGDASRDGKGLLIELYVAKEVAPGTRRGTLRLRCGPDRLDLDLELAIGRFTLPDRLSFVPQMNAYRLPEPPRELAYYRLAHRYRTVLNRLPYTWRGTVAEGLAPSISPRGMDWRAYDARVGPLLDGSAFADLPRAGQPVEAFYLPLNENWPASIADGFTGGYWADDALSAPYRDAFMAGARAFAEHLRERGWIRTTFEFYLNNKLTHKVRRGSWDGGSAPWIFDEPVNFQDFWALRWYGVAFHRAVDDVRGAVPMEFRVDVSRPQWQRDSLDEVAGVYVVGGAVRRYPELVGDRLARTGARGYWYGAANRIGAPNTLSAAWCVEAWSLGLDGVVPWQTIGRDTAWSEADHLSLLYPGRPEDGQGAMPSLRLLAFTRGQQDVEYLNRLAALDLVPLPSLRAEVRERLGFGAPSSAPPTSSDLHRVRARAALLIERALAVAADDGR